jgi:hypothetical protein
VLTAIGEIIYLINISLPGTPGHFEVLERMLEGFTPQPPGVLIGVWAVEG